MWWHSETAQPIGEIALNFGRIEDPVIDENLEVIREATDDAEIEEAAQAINEQFASEVYNVWGDWVFWSIPYADRIHGVRTPINLPDGTPSAIWVNGSYGTICTMQLWVDDAG